MLVLTFGLAAGLSIRASRVAMQHSVDADMQATARRAHATLHATLAQRARDIHLYAGLETMDEILTGDQNLRVQNLLLRLVRTYPETWLDLSATTSDPEALKTLYTFLRSLAGDRKNGDTLDVVAR